MNRHIRIVVSGLVQGVFFRASTEQVALSLGLVGSVRNLSDGSVEIDAQGANDAVERLLTWAQHGPPSARVDKIEVTELELDETLLSFRVRRGLQPG